MQRHTGHCCRVIGWTGCRVAVCGGGARNGARVARVDACDARPESETRARSETPSAPVPARPRHDSQPLRRVRHGDLAVQPAVPPAELLLSREPGGRNLGAPVKCLKEPTPAHWRPSRRSFHGCQPGNECKTIRFASGPCVGPSL